MLLRLTFILLAAVLFATCDKDVESKCTEFRSALVANDEEKILNIGHHYIMQSLLLTNARPKFENLGKHIQDNCNLEGKYTCFQCIHTNPPMSEISIQFLNDETFEQKPSDIWD